MKKPFNFSDHIFTFILAMLFFYFFGFPYLFGYEEIQKAKIYDQRHKEYVSQQFTRVMPNLPPDQIKNDLEQRWNFSFYETQSSTYEQTKFYSGSVKPSEEFQMELRMRATLKAPPQALYLSFTFRLDQKTNLQKLDDATIDFVGYLSTFYDASESEQLKNWVTENIHHPYSSIVIRQQEFTIARSEDDLIGADGKPNIYRTLRIQKAP